MLLGNIRWKKWRAVHMYVERIHAASVLLMLIKFFVVFNSKKLITVSAEIKQNTITPFIFRNYNVQNSPYKGTCEARMWEAALATASAPVFFQPYSFSTKCFPL